jgi:hypothetical protein
MGDHCWIVTGMPVEQKQLIHASQIAAHKTFSAPESPLSLCYVIDRERGGEWECSCAQNSNTCCFVPCGKLTSAYVLKPVMADWNRSVHFDTPCIHRNRLLHNRNLSSHISLSNLAQKVKFLTCAPCEARSRHMLFRMRFIVELYFPELPCKSQGFVLK